MAAAARLRLDRGILADRPRRHGRPLADLRLARASLDREIEDWATTIDEAWLSEPFTYVTLKGDAQFTFPAFILVMQLFNHQIHHRGQVTTLLTQAGEDVGVTDIVGLPGLAHNVVHWS